MEPEEVKKRLGALGQRLDAGGSLTADEKGFLGRVLIRIADGEDPKKVLGLQGRRGQKAADVTAGRRMSLILHWVAGRVEADPGSQKKALSIQRACEEAVGTIVPLAKRMFPGADHAAYDADYLFRCWSDPTNKHMRSPERKSADPDYPYNPY